MMERRRIVIIAALALALGGAWYIWGGSDSGNKAKGNGKPPVSVSIAEVKQQDLPFNLNLVGSAIPYESVALKSRLDSQVLSVPFHDGDIVKEGDTLFVLDDSALKAQLHQFEANLQRDEANLANAKTQYDRYMKLSQSGYASNEQLEQYKAAYFAAKAAALATQASIDNAKVQLNYTIIKAPISGRAGTINVTRGNNVKANDVNPLVTINRVQPIRIQFALPQRYYDSVRSAIAAGKIPVQAIRGDGQSINEGELEYIDNAIDAGNGTFNARAIFANDGEKLWPGMFVNVNIILGTEKGATVIPQVALQGDQDNPFVFTVDASTHKAVKKPIEISRRTADLIVVKSGVAVGDKVIVDGLLSISDGSNVKIPGAEGESGKTKGQP